MLNRIILIITLFTISLTTQARMVTIEFTANVDWIDDYSNVLQGEIALGETITGRYTFDTDLIDNNPASDRAHYLYLGPIPSDVGFTSIKLGNLTYTQPSNTDSSFELWVHNGSTGSSFSASAPCCDLGTLSNGLNVSEIYVDLHSPIDILSSTALEDAVAGITNFGGKQFKIAGTDITYNRFEVNATITSISEVIIAPTSPVHISPASGPLVMNQLFEVGIVVDAGYPPIDYVQAYLNGIDSLNCLINPVSSDGRQTLICPSFTTQLDRGANSLSVYINFIDGQVLKNSVNWDVVGF